MRQILIVDDEKNIRTQLCGLLGDEGYRAFAAEDGEQALELLAEERPDLVILDVRLPGRDGIEVLGAIRERDADLPVIVMSGHGTIETAVQATKLGAFDFLEKPLGPERLLVTVRNALETRTLRRRNRELSRVVGGEEGLVGSGPAITQLRAEMEKAAQAEARVLISGENGTGKELVARGLHEWSPRAGGPFVKVNCAAIPRELIESELFGHEKGAFTGATARKIGKVEAADGGTLLLDEVGDMALEAQAKLLRVLEESEVERVGGNRTIPVDVRVIAATNKDLGAAIAEGEFREDLFYRLNVIPLRVPPLRERAEDIPALIAHFREAFTRDSGRPARRFAEDAIAALAAFAWPGNVRELRNAVERLLIMVEGDEIEASHARALLREARAGDAAADDDEAAGAPDFDGGPQPLRDLLERTERSAIRSALAAAGGTISEAARLLGMDRANLHRKIRRLGIERAEDDPQD